MGGKSLESKKPTVLMIDQCRERGLPPPVWKSDEKLGVTVTFSVPEATPEATPEVLRMVSAIQGEMTRAEIQKKLRLADEKHFRKNYQQPGLKLGVIEMTVPDKPQSPQKYRLTAAGKRLISRDQTVVVVAKKAKATRHEPVTDKVGQA